jgi:hypothetical protein
LTVVMLMFCLAQVGPLIVLIPAVIWTYWTGDTVWGTLLLIWSGFVGTLDNFLRPFLIKKGADLPLLLIFAGVIGGLLSFGLLGIFVGPVVLAVSYKLFQSWVDETGETTVEHDAGAANASGPAPKRSDQAQADSSPTRSGRPTRFTRPSGRQVREGLLDRIANGRKACVASRAKRDVGPMRIAYSVASCAVSPSAASGRSA